MKENDYYLELENRGHFDSMDKRVKEYKDYKEWKDAYENQSEGVGDTIAKITKATGIDKVVKAIVGDDCGCDERKVKFNKIWRYNKVNCIDEKDHLFLTNFMKANKSKVTPKEQQLVLTVYNKIFNTKVKPTNCTSCFKAYLRNLNQYLNIK